jgi:hypothetical protein
VAKNKISLPKKSRFGASGFGAKTGVKCKMALFRQNDPPKKKNAPPFTPRKDPQKPKAHTRKYRVMAKKNWQKLRQALNEKRNKNKYQQPAEIQLQLQRETPPVNFMPTVYRRVQFCYKQAR